jgi:hypothetical protein
MTLAEVLSDEMWACTESVIPPVRGSMGGPMRHDHCSTGAAKWMNTPP